ncbi:MAG: cysteine desulfurase [Thermoanaerobaculia bacterium]|jgi:cysteine desulfurase/selenocysteine lyase
MASPAELLAPAVARLDAARLRADFPILASRVHGQPLVYLDNAATSQKPRQVIERISAYYEQENSNVHRGVHELSEKATAAFEGARARVRSFVNAKEVREIVFTRGTTEAINLVAQSWGHANVKAGDEIVISTIEHHSNIVPWQMLCDATGATLRAIPVNDRGELDLDAYRALLGPKTKLVAIGHVSNALGTINPLREMIALAHAAGALVLVDGAQAVPHLRVDVQALDADFYAFSGHKMYGPTGIGVLYGKAALLEAMPPWMGGGDMILSVTLEKSTWNAIPYKFEAGTPNIADAIGLGAAVDYIESVGIEAIAAWEHELLEYATAKLEKIHGLRIIGSAENKAAVISFVLENAHPHDIGTIVDQEGVAIRTGHHCAQPAMIRFGVPATARASFALYNTKEDVDALVAAVGRVVEIFG